MADEYSRCPESAHGWHDSTDIHGKCLLCGTKIEAAMRRPAPQPGYLSNIDQGYAERWDPDYDAGDPHWKPRD